MLRTELAKKRAALIESDAATCEVVSIDIENTLQKKRLA
jgi:hypothetical protein